MTKNKNNSRKVFKLNPDDIQEILIEHLAAEHEFNTFQANAALFGASDLQDLRFVAVITDGEDDDVHQLDLDKIDQEQPFNGAHSQLDDFLLCSSDLKNNK